MNILLIGEYSRLHNSLKEGLIKLGHTVHILGFNDGFKNYPVDYQLERKWEKGLKKKFRMLLYHAFNFDISSFLTYLEIKKLQPKLKGFDVVQLINENSFLCLPNYEIKILKLLFKNNKKVFLLSCGDDYVNVNYNFNHPEKTVIQPYLEGKIPDNTFLNVLKFRTKPFEELHNYLYKNIRGVIASDFDYHTPLQHNSKYLGMIPNPINIDKFPNEALKIDDKIIIFLGINRESYFKKGMDHFEMALEIIQQKYDGKVEIVKTENLPYQEYINRYNQAHIVLDQCFAKDQGYNALEAMAKGKVVFTGAEKEFLEHYGLKEDEVVINAIPDVDCMVEKMSFLIENPQEIISIGKQARDFIKKEHNYTAVAEKYLEAWKRKNG